MLVASVLYSCISSRASEVPRRVLRILRMPRTKKRAKRQASADDASPADASTCVLPRSVLLIHQWPHC